jgi:peptide/nickel transport system ATP-binding protein
LLHDIQLQRQMAIIFITHDLAIVQQIAHHVLVLHKGKMVEHGTVQQIFNAPNEAYTKGLIHCRPSMMQRLKVLPTIADYLANDAENISSTNIETKQEFAQRALQMNDAPIILEIKNVAVRYVQKKNIFGKALSYFTAIQNINLAVHQGETIGIVGESGCGKTSLGKAIVRLNPINAGEIIYQSKNIFTQWDASYHQQVQIIFQDPYSSLNPRMTIGKAIQEPMDVHNIHEAQNRKKIVEQLLQKVGMLPEHYNRYPHEFSYAGQGNYLRRKCKCIGCECASTSTKFIMRFAYRIWAYTIVYQPRYECD